MTAKQELIDELERKHDAFRPLIADLPDEAYDETWLGTWSLSEVLAHMTGWYQQMGLAMARVGRGERPTPEGVDWTDIEGWNQQFAAQRKPGRAALDEWDEAYASFREAAERLSPDLYGIDPDKDRPRIGNRLMDAAGTGHFAEHQPELEEWIRSR